MHTYIHIYIYIYSKWASGNNAPKDKGRRPRAQCKKDVDWMARAGGVPPQGILCLRKSNIFLLVSCPLIRFCLPLPHSFCCG